MSKIYNLIESYKRIAIIGMEKNVGKTTVLNRIIADVKNRKILGVTSIGRDGEKQDLVTNTPKPMIYVYSGTIIATARESLKHCDITKEILGVTDYMTPLGNIIILRALSDGYVDIAGPSYNTQISQVLKIMESFGSELLMVDGALSRKGSAAANLCDGTILVTGASLSKNMEKVLESTENTSTFLSKEVYTGEFKNALEEELKKNRVVIFYESGRIEKFETSIFLEPQEKIKYYLKEKIKLIGIKGAITDNVIEILIRNREFYSNLEIVGVDGTKFFLSISNMQKVKELGINFKVLKKINLLFIACNPVSPTGYSFPALEFKRRLQERIEHKIINVLEE